MSRTALPAPLHDKAMQRQLRARVHPDAGGSHELSIWTAALLEHVESCADVVLCRAHSTQTTQDRSAPYTGNGNGSGQSGEDSARVPFEAPVDHVALLIRALDLGQELLGPVGNVLLLLSDYQQATSGRGQLAEQRGASYKQLKYLAVLAEIPAREVYAVAERVPLSQAMAHHIITTLKNGGNRT